ncbi:TPA: hypothetical protein N0F65_007675 [Lagenidium giganteum]|uniref:Uncharacterized protein n=1 Tax=Lagenidium giganteum TaxID=4803 RepID=A0AAV2Z8N7_9STRA|nr:TPA: hypothetical protein N0F65_007675 [Lagenidium giganteum]
MGAGASDYFTAYSNVQYGFLGRMITHVWRPSRNLTVNALNRADAELAIENFHELAAKGLFHEVSICLKKGLDPNGRVFPEDDEYEREDTPIICCAR